MSETERTDGTALCPVCHRPLDLMGDGVQLTGYGATCSTECARDLIREHEGGIHRPDRDDLIDRHRLETPRVTDTATVRGQWTATTDDDEAET